MSVISKLGLKFLSFVEIGSFLFLKKKLVSEGGRTCCEQSPIIWFEIVQSIKAPLVSAGINVFLHCRVPAACSSLYDMHRDAWRERYV